MAAVDTRGVTIVVNYHGREFHHYVTPEGVFTPDLAPFVDAPDYDIEVLYDPEDGWWVQIKYDPEMPPHLIALDW